MRKLDDRNIDLGEIIPELDDHIIICRCEEITKGEIREAVHMGMFTMTEVKRLLRPGMGLCQGQTCSRYVRNIIAKELGVSPLEIEDNVARPPMRPIELQVFGNEVESE